MLRGLTVSALVHASVIAAAVLVWERPPVSCSDRIAQLRRAEPGISTVEIVMRLPECAASSDLPIDFAEIGDISDIMATRRAPEPDVRDAPPQTEPAPEPEPEPETPPPPEPEPETPPEVVPDPRRTEPEKAPDPKKEPPAKPKEEPLVRKAPPQKDPPRDDFNLDDFDSALQDKKREPRQAPPRDLGTAAAGDRDRTAVGAGRGNTGSLEAALRRQIGECWDTVEDLPKEDQIDVTVLVKLERDGSLAAPVELVSPARRPVGRAGIAVDRALRAVRVCGETRYRLPVDDYDKWKEIEVTIGPKRS